MTPTSADLPSHAPTLLGSAPDSPAGPAASLGAGERPPVLASPPAVQVLRFLRRPLSLLFGARRELGETFGLTVFGRADPMWVVSHPDHVASLMKAKADLVPSLTAESPLRPVLGQSVLTANGARHLRQRRLLLPPFHGDAIAEYAVAIERVVHQDLDTWRAGQELEMAAHMQAVTLAVIMAGVFGVEGEPEPGTPERGLRDATRRLLGITTWSAWQIVEVLNGRGAEPRGVLKIVLDVIDRHLLRAIAARRGVPEDERGNDVLSLLLVATDEDGVRLTDREVRDELLTLVLAGHETTANQLAWTYERLTRTPAAYDALRAAVRDDGGDTYVEATIHESMRTRPVIPLIGRRVQADWRLGEFVVPSGSRVSVAIPLLHHREDLYPDPFAFRPERFLDTKPGTYSWLPFGGGTRRCLGAALAMAEQRIVLRAIARRTDLEALAPEPERGQHRNVTMIPSRGGRVRVVAVT